MDRLLYMYEDELPYWIDQKTYDTWFELSTIQYGVRIGPKISYVATESNSTNNWGCHEITEK